jgi:Holliday junction resolvasome RuvABC endonuclease subunit
LIPWQPAVLGLDLSLTGTGIARLRGIELTLLTTVRPGSLRGVERLQFILGAITDAQRGEHIDLVVLEGPAYSKQRQRGHHEGAGLWWLVAYGLERAGVPWAIVPPTNRALYAAGHARASKQDVMAAVRDRYGVGPRDDNQADAFVLAVMGAAFLGADVPNVPPDNARAMRGCEWPAVPGEQ